MAPAVLIPLKGFDVAKGRLAGVIDDAARASLARAMAQHVVSAAGSLPVWIACDDEVVAAWALARGAQVVWTHGLDLNGSVQHGIDALAADGASSVVVAHGDLPFAAGLERVTRFPLPGATLVPDRRDDGTNVIHVATGVGFTPMYGPGSFGRHLAQLRELGLSVHIARLPDLQWDVDVPEDLPDGMLVH
jgi:2-phospho-L-lactate guanylyltransferase